MNFHRTWKKVISLFIPLGLLGALAISCSQPTTNNQTPNKEGDLVDVDNGGFGPSGSGQGVMGNIPGRPEQADSPEYQAAIRNRDEKTRFQFDIAAYTKALLAKNATDGKADRDVASWFANANQKLSGNQVNDPTAFDQYNSKAAQLDQYNYQDAYLLNFSTVDQTQKLAPSPDVPITAAYWNSTFGNRGQARLLPNEMYKNIALQTYAIRFNSELSSLKRNDPTAFQMNGSQTIKSDDGQSTIQVAANGIETTNRSEFGTAWILDYMLPTNNSGENNANQTGGYNENNYPTKWYLATNLHVANALTKKANSDPYQNIENTTLEKATLEAKVKALNEFEKTQFPRREKLVEQLQANMGNASEIQKQIDAIDMENFAKNREISALQASFKGLTKSVTLEVFDERTPLGNELGINSRANTVKSFTLQPENIKLIYAGLDFLNSQPKDYIAANNPFFNSEEFADFAVLEIDLASTKTYHTRTPITHQIETHTEANTHKIAQILTNDFANKFQKVEFATQNAYDTYDQLVSNQKSVQLINGQTRNVSQLDVNFLALGFPLSSSDNQIRDPLISNNSEITGFTQSLWVNKRKDLLTNPNDTLAYGSGLSRALGYRSFVSKPGIGDNVIINPQAGSPNGTVYSNYKIANQMYGANNSNQPMVFLNYGLTYALNNWGPAGGSSGSSIRDVDGKIHAINYFGAVNAQTNLALVLRSQGINYNGLYGSYNLEAYDLIYGGATNQKTSYRQALQMAYSGNGMSAIRTSLFPNGLADQNIPEAFKFNK